MGSKKLCIVSVSIWESLKIHLLSFVYGLWLLTKHFLKYVWNRSKGYKSIPSPTFRDNPPLCLVDSSLGLHKYVKLKNTKLHYVEAGDKERPVVLLLHGFPDFWIGWRYQIPILAQDFRVIALDLKGFGDSDKPEWRSSYRIEVILDELGQLISTLGVKSCIVIGHDLGALIGWYFAYHSPNKVEKFFAVSCPHPNLYWYTSTDQWLNCVQLPYLPEIDALKQDVKIIKEYHKNLHSDFLEAYKYSFSRKEDWTGPLNYYRNLPFNELLDNEPLAVHTILITGNKDSLISLEGVIKSTEYCDRTHVKLIEGAGHFPHQENPNAFNNMLIKYLKKKVNREKVSVRLMDRMFGAVSSYGTSVLDSVQKTSVISSIPLLNQSFITASSNKLSLEGATKSTNYCDRTQVKLIEGAEYFSDQENPNALNNMLVKSLKKVNREKSSVRLMDRMFGAVSSYGTSVLDSVQKGTVISSIPLLKQNVITANSNKLT